MKLMYCPKCQDIVKLQLDKRSCSCGDAWGFYKEDGHNAVVSNYAVILGIDNSDFSERYHQWVYKGGNVGFNSFFIPYTASTLERKDT